MKPIHRKIHANNVRYMKRLAKILVNDKCKYPSYMKTDADRKVYDRIINWYDTNTNTPRMAGKIISQMKPSKLQVLGRYITFINKDNRSYKQPYPLFEEKFTMCFYSAFQTFKIIEKYFVSYDRMINNHN